MCRHPSCWTASTAEPEVLWPLFHETNHHLMQIVRNPPAKPAICINRQTSPPKEKSSPLYFLHVYNYIEYVLEDIRVGAMTCTLSDAQCIQCAEFQTSLMALQFQLSFCCPEGSLELGICWMQGHLAVSLCVGYFPDFFLISHHSYLMATGMGMVGHFLTHHQHSKHFRKSINVLDKSFPQFAADLRASTPLVWSVVIFFLMWEKVSLWKTMEPAIPSDSYGSDSCSVASCTGQHWKIQNSLGTPSSGYIQSELAQSRMPASSEINTRIRTSGQAFPISLRLLSVLSFENAIFSLQSGIGFCLHSESCSKRQVPHGTKLCGDGFPVIDRWKRVEFPGRQVFLGVSPRCCYRCAFLHCFQHKTGFFAIHSFKRETNERRTGRFPKFFDLAKGSHNSQSYVQEKPGRHTPLVVLGGLHCETFFW